MSDTDITEVKGIGSSTAGILAREGITTAEDLATANLDRLISIPGFSVLRATRIIADARALLGTADPEDVETEAAATPEQNTMDELVTEVASTAQQSTIDWAVLSEGQGGDKPKKKLKKGKKAKKEKVKEKPDKKKKKEKKSSKKAHAKKQKANNKSTKKSTKKGKK